MTERTLSERLRMEAQARGGALDEYNRQIYDEDITADMLEAANTLDAKSALLAEAVTALEDAMPALEWMYSIMNGGPKRSATLAKLHNGRTVLAKLKAATAKPAPQPEGHGAE